MIDSNPFETGIRYIGYPLPDTSFDGYGMIEPVVRDMYDVLWRESALVELD